jgi:hypothetical protein
MNRCYQFTLVKSLHETVRRSVADGRKVEIASV